MSNSLIKYRVIFLRPNPSTDDRISIGLGAFDEKSANQELYFIPPKQYHSILEALNHKNFLEIEHFLSNWKEKIETHSLLKNYSRLEYMKSYWNGILGISEEKRFYYDYLDSSFKEALIKLKKQIFPFSSIKETQNERKKTIPITVFRKRLKKIVSHYQLNHKISIGLQLPRHEKYNLIKPLTIDIATVNGKVNIGKGLNFDTKEDTIGDNILKSLDAFNRIRDREEGGVFSFFPVHLTQTNKISTVKHEIFQDFKLRCDEEGFKVILENQIENYIKELSFQRLKPFNF